jgi:hypothetical protein
MVQIIGNIISIKNTCWEFRHFWDDFTIRTSIDDRQQIPLQVIIWEIIGIVAVGEIASIDDTRVINVYRRWRLKINVFGKSFK